MQILTKTLWALGTLLSVILVSCNQPSGEAAQFNNDVGDTTQRQLHITTHRGIPVRNDLAPKIEELIEKQAVPSVSIAVFDASDIIRAEAFGKANIAQNVSADLDTVYTTGSTFKTIMVTAIMQLVEAGKIDLDMPINTYLSDPIDDLADQGHPLTVRQTLAHRAGFANARTQGTTDVWSRNPVPSAKMQIDEIQVVAIPGKTFDYCNICFVLFADLIENVTGREVGEYLGSGLIGLSRRSL